MGVGLLCKSSSFVGVVARFLGGVQLPPDGASATAESVAVGCGVGVKGVDEWTEEGFSFSCIPSFLSMGVQWNGAFVCGDEPRVCVYGLDRGVVGVGWSGGGSGSHQLTGCLPSF